MPPRKATAASAEPTPPGPIQFQVRVDDKIIFQQFIYSYEIDQQDDGFTIQGVTKPQ